MDRYIVSAVDELSNERKAISVYGIKWAVKATKIVLDNGYECVICKHELFQTNIDGITVYEKEKDDGEV